MMMMTMKPEEKENPPGLEKRKEERDHEGMDWYGEKTVGKRRSSRTECRMRPENR